MAEQNPQHGRRQHFHRGRRGQDRRGGDRRGPAPAQSAEQGTREHREHVDVEQIMREIRSRISQRHGIELTTQQIQELAARRLEAILDPRTVKPSLLEQIRRSTATPVDAPSTPEPTYSFEDTTIYDSPNGVIRFLRKLLNPLLKLFFNPNPLISALHTQVKLNQAVAQREAERERRQAEWNSLHYEILQRLVLEIARASLEAQQLSMRIESLSAKVEFAERRARSLEGTLHQTRPAPRHEHAPPQPAQIAQQPRESAPSDVSAPQTSQEGAATAGDGSRRRRRRRRGRRPQGFTPEGAPLGAAGGGAAADARMADGGETTFAEDADEDEGGPENGEDNDAFEATAAPANQPSPDEVIAEANYEEASAAPEPPSYASPVQPLFDHPVETHTETGSTEERERPQPPDPSTPDER